MNKKSNKVLTLICGFFLPVILTFLLPLLKILLLDQQNVTGFMDGTLLPYLGTDLIINGVWAAGILIYSLWNIGNSLKSAVMSNIFTAVCALSGCYIVLMRTEILYFVRMIDTSTYTLETIVLCLSCGLLARKVYFHKR
ncbi:hypothetical protein [Anaerostipes sp.]|uniref:hypothetical protein n=1 Tax=Anaerostipes sp. TaxID=1872530 RepID=UPI0025C30795|nr:hypothetical protein [Anaerostipes sp.]MBS7009908.1 hypothetical protein [Anaerostipes sp.]